MVVEIDDRHRLTAQSAFPKMLGAKPECRRSIGSEDDLAAQGYPATAQPILLASRIEVVLDRLFHLLPIYDFAASGDSGRNASQ